MRREILLTHEFVEFVPDELRERTLYVSIRYKTVVHLCCCGCGCQVVTPLSPTAWKLTFDGASISLNPSIGSWNLRCKSHYWIDRNRVKWAGRWSPAQIEAGRAAEARARTEYYGDEPAKAEPHEARPAPIPKAIEPADARAQERLWRRWWRRLFGL
jgi:hypothetical protein